MTYRAYLKKFVFIRNFYYYFLYVKNLIKSKLNRLKMFLFGRNDYILIKDMEKVVRPLFTEQVKLANEKQFYFGKNIIGYPAMGQLVKDGEMVGWAETVIKQGEFSLPFLQLKTDMDRNFPMLFKKYLPEYVVDFGTASGGSAVYFYQLMEKYSKPNILSIDITEADYESNVGFHNAFKSKEKMEFIFGKSTLDCLPEVSKFLANRQPGQKVLLSFDDDHHYPHTFFELEMYAPILKPGDAILMQDTWNQNLFGHEVSPMLSVHRFLKSHPDFMFDKELFKQIVLPCNFIYGVIIKR